MKHKPIPTAIRKRVYDKYAGHCAYCGCELRYEDMQVDHAQSVYHTTIENGWIETQDDSFDNLMPSCRQCNYYKGESNIEGFRTKIADTLQRTCIDTPQARLAIKYGIITTHLWDGKFYFEK